MNLGMSENFGFIDLEHLTFPTTMSVDYVRVYQPKGSINIGCDPEEYPTEAYINQYVPECFLRVEVNSFLDITGHTQTPTSLLGRMILNSHSRRTVFWKCVEVYKCIRGLLCILAVSLT